MSDATAGLFAAQTAKKEDVELPAPVPFGAPVFIGDCVTPFAGETMLLSLLRYLDREKDQP